MSRLVLAIPSKGRLQEQVMGLLDRAGLSIERERGDRDYRGRLAGIPEADVVLLSASEIASEIAAGNVHFGVSGEDLLHEAMDQPETVTDVITRLGFGFADVVIAVPKPWIDVETMGDLEDVAAGWRARHHRSLRVATKYLALTRRFFGRHGISDYRIIESLGATEGAPLAGAADIIVDITTTGATLAANGLKTLRDGTILRSQAALVASLRADWSPAALDAARVLLMRLKGESIARTQRELRLHGGAPARLPLEAMAKAAGGQLLSADGSGSSMLVPAKTAIDVAEQLTIQGAGGVTMAPARFLLQDENDWFDTLTERLANVSLQ
jgi:ATP phosphoribosyltransferase